MGARRMLERIYIKNNLGFCESELSFGPGLSVFTGISGAGKSVLIGAILAVFGLNECEAELIEADVEHKFDMENFGLINDTPNIFRVLKERSLRYFINSQSVSKKNLSTIAGEYVKFLGAKNAGEMSSGSLLKLLDFIAAKKDAAHAQSLSELQGAFVEFSRTKKQLDEILDQGFTRIPIYTETIDKIVGTVHMKDLLRYDKQTGENPPIKDFMKEAYFVPITKSLIELLEEFKLKQLHMAIVIDEYGGTQGIVTIEDLLEEIVGEIRDEFDQEEENIQQIREKIFDIKGDTPIEEINDKLEIEIPLSEEYDTISGYIQDKLGKVADVFDQVKGDNFVLKVTDVDNKRVERVRAVIIEQEKEE